MKEQNVFLSLVLFIILLVAMLLSDIGYANENIQNYNIYNNIPSSEFDVSFNTNSKDIDNNIEITTPQTASIKNIVLTEVGESKKILIPIINNSDSLSAKVSFNISNTNKEYFKVSYDISKDILKPNLDEALVEITIQLIKMPTNSIQKTNFSIDINANPIY